MDKDQTSKFLEKMNEVRSNSLLRSKTDLKLHSITEGIYDNSYMVGYNDAIYDIMDGKYPELTNKEVE